jgi:hypothetical protein
MQSKYKMTLPAQSIDTAAPAVRSVLENARARLAGC